MDRALLPGMLLVAVVAGLVAAGASYVAVSSLGPREPAEPPVAKAPPEPDAAAPNATNATEAGAVWVFQVRGTLPEGPGERGTVVVFLAKVQGDANVSAANGSIPVEVAAVAWDARAVAPVPNGTILQAMNLQFQRAPPVALTRAALSRDQDAVELTIPSEGNVTTIVVNAPATGGFLAVHWPSGSPYAWGEEQRAWGAVQEPTLLARPLGGR